MNGLSFPVLSSVLVFLLLLISSFYIRRLRIDSEVDWSQIIARLEPVNREGIYAVANNILEDTFADDIDSEGLLEMLDGMSGLNRMDQNCDVLIDLAAYVQRWYPADLKIAEELTLNAREFHWRVERLRTAASRGKLVEQFNFYGPRAVANYYLMTRTLMLFYEGVLGDKYIELQQLL